MALHGRPLFGVWKSLTIQVEAGGLKSALQKAILGLVGWFRFTALFSALPTSQSNCHRQENPAHVYWRE
ncbi:MAG TPA: hypothetical protein VIV82_12260, partial [Verrucomicrobiae bacterium]